MKNTLPSLTCAILLCLASPVSLIGEDEGAAATPGDGQLLVRQAVATVAQYSSIQARVRQRVHLFDRKLAGSGTYHQVRDGERILLRLELKLPAGEYVTTLQQVNDGDRLWTRRDTPLDQRLTSVELRRVRRVIQDRDLPALRQLALGGLGQLLVGMDQQFEFAAPRSGSLGGVPVWVLEGRWKQPDAESLAAAGQGRGALDLPHVPETVLLVLSRSEQLPLFPFRIEFARHPTQPESAAQRQPLLSIDFYEVTVGTPLDLRLFSYNAGDQEVIDTTDAFLKSW